MDVDSELVKRVAHLARLSVDPQQLGQAANQLTQILGYVEQLSDAPVAEDVEPFFGVPDQHDNAVRSDEVKPSVDRETILKNAPDTDGQHYRVPPVF